MKLLAKCASLAFVAAVLAMPITATAAPVTFFGEDLGLGESTRLPAHPFADAARALFLSNLIGVGTETFEGFSGGTGAPLPLVFPGAGTATLIGDGSIVSVPSGTNGFGRYPISGDKFWETYETFSISFSNRAAWACNACRCPFSASITSKSGRLMIALISARLSPNSR